MKLAVNWTPQTDIPPVLYRGFGKQGFQCQGRSVVLWMLMVGSEDKTDFTDVAELGRVK